jgi:histidinol-phosphatase
MDIFEDGLLLQTALDAAQAAAGVIRAGYAGDFAVRVKADQSPVTEVDEASERIIKDCIRARFPDHGFYGEEYGRENADADFLWLIDPIDGTKAFVRGYPMFSTQLALMVRGELVLGVSSAPCWGDHGELFYAVKGKGAWRVDGVDAAALPPTPVRVSSVSEITDTALSMGNIGSFARTDAFACFGREVIARLQRIRGYGDFLHYHLLAGGKIDAVLESDVNILDIAALAVIVREAGGVFTQMDGGELTLDTRSVLAAATPKLHQTLLSAVR